MDAVAITDHGAMFGVIDFYKEAKKQGIKPIIGCEVYTAARTMHDKDAEKDKRQGHLVLLAKNETGYRNLMKIVSAGYTEGFYYKPRIDHALLRRYSEGIIALFRLPGGRSAVEAAERDYEGAKKEALTLLASSGRTTSIWSCRTEGLKNRSGPARYETLREETGIPFAATNDVHYWKKEDAAAHDVLLCIQTAKTVDDENRMRFPNDQFYLKSELEMERIFADLPEAIENTKKIADPL
jgi:DNA polymerase-3 subunit alpha